MKGSWARGSGIIFNGQGLVLTCFHNVSDEPVRISQDGENFYNSEIYAKEPIFDLALLKTELFRNINVPNFVSRQELKINQDVFSYGAPFGLSNSFLRGYISHLERKGVDPGYSEIPFIQTMGLTFKGASGAGVYTSNGKLIGLNRATFGFGAESGIGLIIPSGYIEVFLDKHFYKKKLD